MTAPSTTPDASSEIEQIKRRALKKFHNDHADGDLAIFDVVEALPALIAKQRERARQEVLDELEQEVGATKGTPAFGSEGYGEQTVRIIVHKFIKARRPTDGAET